MEQSLTPVQQIEFILFYNNQGANIRVFSQDKNYSSEKKKKDFNWPLTVHRRMNKPSLNWYAYNEFKLEKKTTTKKTEQ